MYVDCKTNQLQIQNHKFEYSNFQNPYLIVLDLEIFEDAPVMSLPCNVVSFWIRRALVAPITLHIIMMCSNMLQTANCAPKMLAGA